MSKLFNYTASIVRWVDGDTVIVDIDLGFYVTRQERLRVARIDTPEIRTRDKKEKAKGLKATEVVNRLCPVGSKVKIHTVRKDRYARYITEIWNGDEINVSDYLIEKGLAKEVAY